MNDFPDDASLVSLINGKYFTAVPSKLSDITEKNNMLSHFFVCIHV